MSQNTHQIHYNIRNKHAIDEKRNDTSLDYAYKIIVADIVGLLVNELSSQYKIRDLTPIVNRALRKRNIHYSYQRLHKLMQNAKGGDQE